jgi:hypothetical protein
MKKIILVLVACILMGGSSTAGFLNHPNWSNINTFTASIVQSISNSQAEFYAVNGRYFQGKWLLGDQQVDGTADVSVDNATSPSDFGFTWKDFNPVVFKNNLKIPVNVKIDVYESPDGWGWTLRAEAYVDGLDPDQYGNYGNHWVYIHHEGPKEADEIFDEWYVQIDEL